MTISRSTGATVYEALSLPESISIASVFPSAENEWQLPQVGRFSRTTGGGSGDETVPNRQRMFLAGSHGLHEFGNATSR